MLPYTLRDKNGVVKAYISSIMMKDITFLTSGRWRLQETDTTATRCHLVAVTRCYEITDVSAIAIKVSGEVVATLAFLEGDVITEELK